MKKLLSVLNENYDIVIGSRSIENAQIKVHQPFYREDMSIFLDLLKIRVLHR